MAAGGLPPRRVDQQTAPSPGLPPAPSTPAVARRVVIAGSGDIGLFVYNGAPIPANLIFSITTASITDAGLPYFIYSGLPVLGNLIASIANSGGTDPKGNVYQAGVVSYANDGFGTFTQVDGGLFVLGNTAHPTVATGAGALNLQTNGAMLSALGSTGGGVLYNTDGTVQVLQHGPLIASNPSTGLEETWHAMSPLAAGFAAGSPTPRYRLMPDGTVMCDGQVSLTANEAAATQFFAWPTGYAPVNSRAFATVTNTGATLNSGSVIATTAGLALGAAGVNGNVVWLDGVRFSTS